MCDRRYLLPHHNIWFLFSHFSSLPWPPSSLASFACYRSACRDVWDDHLLQMNGRAMNYVNTNFRVERFHWNFAARKFSIFFRTRGLSHLGRSLLSLASSASALIQHSHRHTHTQSFIANGFDLIYKSCFFLDIFFSSLHSFLHSLRIVNREWKWTHR